MSEEPIHNSSIFRLEGLMNLFLRVIAIIFLWFSMRYWMLLVGIDDPQIRFDTMQLHWQIAAANLSVLYPIAALGLWGLFRWGIVIWIITAGMELVMYVGYPDLFGTSKPLVIFHLTSIATWLVYAAIRFLESRRALVRDV